MGMVWETYHRGVPLLGVPGKSPLTYGIGPSGRIHRWNKVFHLLPSFQRLAETEAADTPTKTHRRHGGVFLDLLVWWLKKSNIFPHNVVKHGDESHGIESAKNHKKNKSKFLGEKQKRFTLRRTKNDPVISRILGFNLAPHLVEKEE